MKLLFEEQGTCGLFRLSRIQSMQDSLQLLTKKDVYVVGVTPQTDPNIQKTADRHHTSFSMLHDKDYTHRASVADILTEVQKNI